MVIVVMFASPFQGDAQMLIGEGAGSLEVWSAARRLEEEAARLLAAGAPPLQGRGGVVELEGFGGMTVKLSPDDVVISLTWEERGREPVLDYLVARAATPDHLYAAGRALHGWADFNVWNSRYKAQLADLEAAERPAEGPGRHGRSARDAIVRASRLPNLERMGTD